MAKEKEGGKSPVYHNPAPEEAVPFGAPKDVVKREFAKRLQAAITARGWNQSELARAAGKYLPSGKFGRDNVSNYVRGLVLPGPPHLNALAEALKVSPDDLLPSRYANSVENDNPPLSVKELEGGRVWLRVNQAVDWEDALKILAILKG